MSIRKSIAVTDLDTVAFHARRHEPDWDALRVDLLRTGEPSRRMIIGRAFHGLMEQVIRNGGASDVVEHEGILFDLDEVDIELPVAGLISEVPVNLCTKVGGEPVLVRGRVDLLDDVLETVHELKTMTRWIGKDDWWEERYWKKHQWRAYMLANGAERVRYHLFQLNRGKTDKKTGVVTVKLMRYDSVDLLPYDALNDDFAEAVRLFVEVVDEHVPEYWDRGGHRHAG